MARLVREYWKAALVAGGLFLLLHLVDSYRHFQWLNTVFNGMPVAIPAWRKF